MSKYSPSDIYKIVVEEDLVSQFMSSLVMHKQQFTIAEITDAKFREREDGYHLIAPSYKINLKIEDDDVLTALMNGLYVSAFISRKDDRYNVHFLVHRYPVKMKSKFEEEILQEVIRYMTMGTIVTLRLDTPEKVREYCGIKA